MPPLRTVRNRSAVAAITLACGLAAAWLAATLPARASAPEYPVVQVFAVPPSLLPAGARINPALGPVNGNPLPSTDPTLPPPIFDPAAPTELFAVSDAAGHPSLLQASQDGAISRPAHPGDAGAAPLAAMVNGHGVEWAVSNTGLYAIGWDGTSHPVATPGGDVRGAVLGLDGRLNITDHGGTIKQCTISTAPPPPSLPLLASASCGQSLSLTGSFLDAHPEAIASAGARLWFTTDASELGSMGVSGGFEGPYVDQPDSAGDTIGVASASPRGITLGANGYLWAVGSNLDTSGVSPVLTGAEDAIVEIDARDTIPRPLTFDTVIDRFSSGLAPGAQLTAIATGPDGDLWFTEEGTGDGGEIGQLDPSTGLITNYTLPAGYELAGAGTDALAPGPAGSYSVWFAARTSGGAPAIGEVTGVGGTPQASVTTITTTTTTTTPNWVPFDTGSSPPPPRPGTLRLGGKANVSSAGVASIAASCRGARCAGRLTLERKVRATITRKGRKVTVWRTVSIGAAGYSLAAGRHATLKLKLSSAGRSALRRARGHRLVVTAAARAGGGTRRVSLTLLGRG